MSSRPNRRRTRACSALLGVVCAALVLTGCRQGLSPGPGPQSTGEGTESTGSTTPTSSAEPTATAPAPLSRLEITLEPLVDGLDKPLYVTHAGDGSGRIFVVEQSGRVRVVRGDAVQPGAFLDVAERISTGSERGLLGMAFAPDYQDSGRFYVNYTDTNGDTNIVRFIAEDPASDTPKLSEGQLILKVPQPFANHNGGDLEWAPDGRLWVGMGDGGGAGDPGNRAQNPKQLLGKMLSFDVSGDEVGEPRVESIGMRNPWRFSFDPATDDLWIADVGQNAWEEVNVVPFATVRGRNFGWHYWEGTHRFLPGGRRGEMTFPVIEYDRETGQSVTGGYVYRGKRYPAMVGTYFYADFVSGWVAGARKSGDRVSTRTLVEDSGGNPSSFGVDEDGELYLCDLNGAVLRVTGRER